MSSYQEGFAPEFPPLGTLSIWFGAALIGITAVAHILIGPSSQLWANPVMTSLQLALVVLIVGSLLYLLLRIGDNAKLAAVPLFINISTLLIVRFVPFAGLWQDMWFQWNYSRYSEVVQLVENGAVLPDSDGFAILPSSYRALTNGGDTINIDKSDGITRIFFYTDRQSTQFFSGYLYHADNNPPQTGEFNGRWRYVVQKRPNWFYCASY